MGLSPDNIKMIWITKGVIFSQPISGGGIRINNNKTDEMEYEQYDNRKRLVDQVHLETSNYNSVLMFFFNSLHRVLERL